MTVTILKGDCRSVLATLPAESVHCVVTSPPYFGLRDYGMAGQIGLEPTPDAFTAEIVRVFAALRRVLREDGTIWLNLGDSYNAHPGQRKTTDKIGAKQETNAGSNTIGSRSVDGIKAKDLIGVPWLVAFALRADGWYLRQDIIWSKPNPMPESVRDRCTKAHEYLFLLSKSERYHYDADAIAEDSITGDVNRPRGSAGANNLDSRGNAAQGIGKPLRDAEAALQRNRRSVWNVATAPYADAHFATFPPALIEPCILAGCPKGGTVLDPFGGAGTTGLVADRLGRNAVLIELNPDYADMAERRIKGDAGMFAEVVA